MAARCILHIDMDAFFAAIEQVQAVTDSPIPSQHKFTNAYRNRTPLWIPHPSEPVESPLKDLLPLQIVCGGVGCYKKAK